MSSTIAAAQFAALLFIAAASVAYPAPASACGGTGTGTAFNMIYISGQDKVCGAITTAHWDNPLVLQKPMHGTATFDGNRATYAANPGYAGPDAFLVGGQLERTSLQLQIYVEVRRQ